MTHSNATKYTISGYTVRLVTDAVTGASMFFVYNPSGRPFSGYERADRPETAYRLACAEARKLARQARARLIAGSTPGPALLAARF